MTRRKRPRWVCRPIGHRHRSPIFGCIVHLHIPSAEGSMGMPDARGRLIGTCGCGHEWWSGR